MFVVVVVVITGAGAADDFLATKLVGLNFSCFSIDLPHIEGFPSVQYCTFCILRRKSLTVIVAIAICWLYRA
jgi:hypothetical protein